MLESKPKELRRPKEKSTPKRLRKPEQHSSPSQWKHSDMRTSAATNSFKRSQNTCVHTNSTDSDKRCYTLLARHWQRQGQTPSKQEKDGSTAARFGELLRRRLDQKARSFRTHKSLYEVCMKFV